MDFHRTKEKKKVFLKNVSKVYVPGCSFMGFPMSGKSLYVTETSGESFSLHIVSYLSIFSSSFENSL